MFRRCFILMLLTVGQTTVQAESESDYSYYRECTDSGGALFTDRPRSRSSELRSVRAPLGFSFPQVQGIGDDSTSQAFVKITSPLEGEAVRSNLGQLKVHAEFGPPESGNFSCELALNGQWITSSAECEFLLEHLERGQHRLQVRLKDAEDELLAQSEELSFHLLRYAIPRDQQPASLTEVTEK